MSTSTPAQTTSPSVAPAPTNAPAAQPAAAPTAVDIIQRLAASGLPIGDTVEYDASNDPNGNLGQPDQYTGKAAWTDNRLARDCIDGPSWECGGDVEVFADPSDTDTRWAHLAQLANDTFVGGYYMWRTDLAIIRIGFNLTQADALTYQTALNDTLGTAHSLVELNPNSNTPPPPVPAATELSPECNQQLAIDTGTISAALDRLDTASGTTDDLADDIAAIGAPLGAACGMATGLAMTELANYLATQTQQRPHATAIVVHNILGGFCTDLDKAFHTYPALETACDTPTPTTTTTSPPPPPQPVVVIPTPAPQPTNTYYENCDAARAAGAAPLHRGDPGYRAGLDRDDDGVACE